MECPQCRCNRSKVIEKRNHFSQVRRRRQCIGCGHRYTTTETIRRKVDRVDPAAIRQAVCSAHKAKLDAAASKLAAALTNEGELV